jgi:hypothetical protein
VRDLEEAIPDAAVWGIARRNGRRSAAEVDPSAKHHPHKIEQITKRRYAVVLWQTGNAMDGLFLGYSQLRLKIGFVSG